MELSLSHTLHRFNIFREYDGKDNCAQVLEEEIYKMFGTKYLNDEQDCNVVSINSLNIHDANDMQSHKLGEAMFDEDDIFCPSSFDEQIYYDESMPPIYDDYCDDTYALKNNNNNEPCHLDLNFQSHDSYFVEFAPKILLVRNSGSIIRNSNTINCFHIKRVMFRKRVIIIMTSFINIIITTFYSISIITIIIISSNFVLIIIN